MRKNYTTPAFAVYTLKTKTLMAGSYDKPLFTGNVNTDTGEIMTPEEEAGAKYSYFFYGFED